MATLNVPGQTTPYTVPQWNSSTGEGSLSYLAGHTGNTIQSILAANQGNPSIYYHGADPRLRFGGQLNVPKGNLQTGSNGAGIASTTGYRSNLGALGNQMNDYVQNDPYAAIFAQLQQRQLDTGAGAEKTSRLQASADSAKYKKSVGDQYNSYKAGIETSGISSGVSQYAPNIQMDRLETAHNEMRNKIFEIDQAEKLALAKAKQAHMDNDLAVLKEQTAYIKDLRDAKAEALKNEQQMAWEKEKFAKTYALDQQKEARLAGGGGTEKKLTVSEINAYNLKYGINFPYGTTKAEADAALAGMTGKPAVVTETLGDLQAQTPDWFDWDRTKAKKLEDEGVSMDVQSKFIQGLANGNTLQDTIDSYNKYNPQYPLTPKIIKLLEEYTQPVE